MGTEFGMGAVSLVWVNTAFLLAAAIFLIPFGKLGDVYGRTKIFKIGVAALGVSSALLAFASSGGQLIAFRVVQGISSAMVFATALPILISVVPPQDRGRVIGITIGAVYLGLSIGPFVGGLITQHLGWRFIFGLNIPLASALFVVAVVMLKEERTPLNPPSFDYRGAIILGVGLSLLMYGFSKLPSVPAATMLSAGIATLIGFVVYERRQPGPLVDMALFTSNTAFAFSNLAALINYAATFAVTFVLSLYLQSVRGFTPQGAGTILVAQPIVMTIFSPLAGRLSDKIQPRTIASIGMAITAIGLAMLTVLSSSTPLVYLIAALIVLGFGFALFSSPNTNAIMSSVDRSSYGLAGSIVSAMRQTGMMFSMGIVAMIQGLFIGSAAVDSTNLDKFVPSCRVTFAVFALLCVGGIFASLARGKVERVR